MVADRDPLVARREAVARVLRTEIERLTEAETRRKIVPAGFTLNVEGPSYAPLWREEGWLDKERPLFRVALQRGGDVLSVGSIFDRRVGQWGVQLRAMCLGRLYTHPDARGKGFAGMLLSEVLRYLTNQRSGAAFLTAGPDAQLFERAGLARLRFVGEPSSSGAELVLWGASVVPGIELSWSDGWELQPDLPFWP